MGHLRRGDESRPEGADGKHQRRRDRVVRRQRGHTAQWGWTSSAVQSHEEGLEQTAVLAWSRGADDGNGCMVAEARVNG
jgi:hypothetical protein